MLAFALGLSAGVILAGWVIFGMYDYDRKELKKQIDELAKVRNLLLMFYENRK